MAREEIEFPLLRSSLAPEYAEISYDELAEIVESLYGFGTTPEDVEGFFDDVGKAFKSAGKSVGQFAQKAAPMIAKAAPNILQGASSGMAFGPWGALAGAVAGGASGIMQQSGNKTLRGIGSAMHQVGSMASSLRGGGNPLGSLGSIATGAQGRMPGGANLAQQIFGAAGGGRGAQGAGGGATSQLMGMLARPETLQGLLSSSMGQFGNRNLKVGGQQVPVHTLLSALSSLAGRAAGEAAEYAENAEETPEFILAAGESIGIDPESAEGRRDAVLTLLALTPSIWAASHPQQPTNITVNTPPGYPGYPSYPSQQEAVFDFGEDSEGGEEWPEWPGDEWAEDYEMEGSDA